jgi:hypothetical protein
VRLWTLERKEILSGKKVAGPDKADLPKDLLSFKLCRGLFKRLKRVRLGFVCLCQ